MLLYIKYAAENLFSSLLARVKEKLMNIEIREGEEFIRLGQALKKAGLVGSGVDAKMIITDGAVTVNGEVEKRRGRKLYAKDVISFDGETYDIVK